VGKISFGANKLAENILALVESIIKLKPASSKGTYLKAVSLSTTMGPGIKIDPLDIRNNLKSWVKKQTKSQRQQVQNV